MSHDPKNPFSNETGEYLQEVAEAPKPEAKDAGETNRNKLTALTEKLKPAKKTSRK